MARLGRSYPWRGSGLKQAGVVNPAPPTIFLPTLGTHLQAVRRSQESAIRQPKSTQLLSRKIPVLPTPNLFLPTYIKPLLNAVPRAIQSSLRKPLSTRIRPPTVISPTPNLFLPTLGTHLNAIQRSRDAYKFKGKSQRTGTNPYLLLPPAFLPTLGVKLQAVKTNQVITRRFKYVVKLFPATVVSPRPNLFLPTVNTKLADVDNALRDRRLFRNSTKLRPPTVISPTPNLFLPTLGQHLVAITAAADRRKFKGKTQRTGTASSLLRRPPFLPTLGRYLQAIPRALNQDQKKPYSTKLGPPTVIIPKPLFLPTLGKYLFAVNKALSTYRLRPTSTNLQPPSVVVPFIPNPPSFSPNYDLPPDTLWQQNPTYLKGAVGYDDPNTLFDANYPFDGAPTKNITSVYPVPNQLWDPDIDSGKQTLWQENPAYQAEAVFYDDSNTLFDAPIPFDGATSANLTTVYAPSDTIWKGKTNV